MPQVQLARKAQQDLPRLHAFLAAQDMDAANRAIDTILDAFTLLTTLPQAGVPVPDSRGLRKLVIPFGATGYAALYRFDTRTDIIRILAIKHQRENDYR